MGSTSNGQSFGNKLSQDGMIEQSRPALHYHHQTLGAIPLSPTLAGGNAVPVPSLHNGEWSEGNAARSGCVGQNIALDRGAI